MDYPQQVERYIFRKPLWRKVLPVFLIGLIWIIPALLWRGTALKLPEPFDTWPAIIISWVNKVGITLANSSMTAAILSLLLVAWWYFAFEILIISADAITRSSLLGFRTTLRWVDVDEVLIDHLEARMEGDATAKKTLHLYELPKGIFQTRRRMTVNNRQFDGFEDVERIAVLVSVPAVAERLRQRAEATGRPAQFSLRYRGEALIGLVVFLAGIALGILAFYDPFWATLNYPKIWLARPVLIVAGVLMIAFAVFKLFYRQIGVDREHVYIMRRNWVQRKIPIDNIADIQIRENQMRIYAFVKDPDVPKQVFKTNRYIRNRGVLLRLIREQYDHRRTMDAQVIPAAQAQGPVPTQ